jgi:predicted DNA-binding ribbon-helix-helix protein
MHSWQSLKEIASEHDMTPSELVADINSERRHANLSSAIRLFVLDFYRQQIPASKRRHCRDDRQTGFDSGPT